MNYSTMIFMAGLLGAGALQAQTGQLITELKQNYQGIKNDVTKSAAKMSDADYAFKATPQVRSYGEIVTHIAEVQLALCGMANGEQKHLSNPKATSKSDAEAMLREAFDYCDPVYNGLTDASALQTVKFFGGRDRSRFGVLDFGVIHDNEMYGTMVVYLRLKGLVPSSSEGRGMGGGKKKE